MATTETPIAKPPVRTFAYSITTLVMSPHVVRAVDQRQAPDTVDLHLGGGIVTTASLAELEEYVSALGGALASVRFARELATECAEVRS